jgi:leucyl aminopeptidase
VGRIGAEATVFARDLENQPSNLCTPNALAAAARSLAGRRIRVRVLDERAMAKLGMHALLGVARGSAEPPRFLVLEYRAPKAKGTVCVVGKGLTFDTGGISIKPAAKMDEMRYDMCGAGAVLGLFHALAHGGLGDRALGCNVVGLIAATENAIGPRAQKPGDVVRAMDGHTIEVLNTDAEGRLVLADAICYAKKFHAPQQIVDLATLTGAVVVALGHEVAGIMGNDQKLVDALVAAGRSADEPLWQLPLWDCHKEQMKSRFADLANINGAQFGNGSIAGAAFLSYFVGDTPWVHLDIAGTAYGGLAKDYYRGGAAGTAVRTLLHWVRSLS